MGISSAEKDYKISKLYSIRHSCSHVMAQAVLELIPGAKMAIGPAIKDGFYYDFDLPKPLQEEDLEKIETRMKELIKEGHTFQRMEVSPDEVRNFFKEQPYKIEIMEDILKGQMNADGEKVKEETPTTLTIYKHSNFYDLCAGPHVESLKEVDPDAVKLLRIAGAYWRGDESNPMLQRIYGTAFENKKDLDAHLEKLEEAKKRDHRVLGKKYDLFSSSETVGQGLVLWHPKGATMRRLAERFSQDAHILNGYEWVYTPHIGRSELWKISGHLDFYKDSMYRPIDIESEEYYLKPMNCPFHIEIYKNHIRSYRELPIRLAEFGSVYRYERSGVLQGLTRVRGFTQDDAHIFCTPEQVEDEIVRALKFSLYVLRSFGLENYQAYISTKPEKKFVGSEENWAMATETLKHAAESEGVPYQIDEGGGAFYGPKIDLKLLDFLDREWQLSTVQFDFNLPERFQMEYVGKDGQNHRPFMVHRALFGSYERFFGMLIEQYAGAFPFWIAPTQVIIIPIADSHLPYAEKVCGNLKGHGLRVLIDTTNDRMQSKIRNAEIDRIPYIFVVGGKEIEKNVVAVRSRDKGDCGQMSIDSFLDVVKDELSQGIARVI
ncbi:MAG: threonine--tRNA ligase [SAR324 cluster bacterium]|uniref:Threonine--tRNA ligase n=1 Tax=SAR324 cluster bacterium TaxID=2024889 RepID=A0A7X9FRL2_9DELT|nr:threonine--tRNA ligase [SAR324 cluster bacterium]